MSAGGELNATTRRVHLARMSAEPLDVLVVGGGITGAGVALDAAARGYRVGLIERGDFASGTSSASTKLVHGGIRYLPQLDIPLVREALIGARTSAAQRPASGASAGVSAAALRRVAPSRWAARRATRRHRPGRHPRRGADTL